MPWGLAAAVAPAVIGAISGGGSSNGATTSTQQQRGLPPDIANKFTGMLDTAGNVAGLPYTPYTGPRIAGFNQTQTGAMNRVIDQANAGGTQAQGIYQGVADAGTPMIRGAQFTDYNLGNYMNPEIQNVVDTSSNDLRHQLDITQNQQRARDAAEGSFGGGRSQVATSLNDADFGRTLASTVANLRSNAYNNATGLIEQDAARRTGADQSNQSSAINRLSQNLSAAQGVGSEARGLTSDLMGVGNTQQGQDQKNLDLGYQDFLNQRNWPYTQLGLLQNAYSAFPANAFSNTTGTQTESGGGAGALGLLQSGVGALGQSGAFGKNGWLTGDGGSSGNSGFSFTGQNPVVSGGSYFNMARGGVARGLPPIDMVRGYDSGGEVWDDPGYVDASDTSGGGDLGNDYGGADDWRDYQAQDFGSDLDSSNYVLPGVTPVIGSDRVQVGAPSGMSSRSAGVPTGLAAISGVPPKAERFSADDPMWTAMIVGGGKATASRAPRGRALGEGLAAYGETLESTRKNRQAERLSEAQIGRLDAQTDMQRAQFERQSGLMDQIGKLFTPQAAAATMPAGASVTGAAPGTGTAAPQAPTTAFRPSDAAWPAISKQESGGQQTNPDGTPKRSMPNDPDSPVGVGQIRPSTAADTAKKNGIIFDADKLASNANYNERLAKLHYDELYGKYGNAPLALAAYNWGQGNLDKALQTSTGADGQIDPQKLYGSMPDETKKYLRATLPAIQKGPAGVQQVSGPNDAPLINPTQATVLGLNSKIAGLDLSGVLAPFIKPEAVYLGADGKWKTNPTVAEAEGMKAKAVSNAQLADELSKITARGEQERQNQTQAAGLRTKTVRVNGRDIEVPESAAARIGQQQLDAAGLGEQPPVPTAPAGQPQQAAAGAPQVGKGLFDEATVEAYKKPLAETIEAGQNAPTSLQKLELLEQASKGFRTGPTAPARQAFGKAMLDGLQSIGVAPSKELTDRVAAGEEISKYAGQLGFELSRTLGSREAAQIVQQAIKLNPNIEMSPQGFQTILSSIKQGVKRDADKRDFLEAWMPAHGNSPVGFDKAFNEANPVEMYVSRAVPYPRPTNDADLIPKVIYRSKNGKEAVWTGKAFEGIQ